MNRAFFSKDFFVFELSYPRFSRLSPLQSVGLFIEPMEDVAVFVD